MIAIMSQPLLEQLLAKSSAHKQVPKDGHVFHRGDVVQLLFVILEGSINLVRFQDDGNVAVLQRANAGSILAEASVFADQHHCDAVALTPAKVAGVPVSSIRNLIENDPNFARAWIIHLSSELQNSRKRSEITALKTVTARLSAWTAWNDREPSKGDWKNVAAEIGVSAEALYRELAKRRFRSPL
ncbi:Crp/Fnr family transcriptional regulator [Neorhizobium sp. T25_13]|uniref:Crp/Fnr family transcriptional regulator n=1 Tax=Neorhizobium sp. T25_13 TaxID=2093830 RepID=UPI000CF9A622|nr:Crp/Fnr family transcriptional regulator [Neorhizobium sp. T25_13]